LDGKTLEEALFKEIAGYLTGARPRAAGENARDRPKMANTHTAFAIRRFVGQWQGTPMALALPPQPFLESCRKTSHQTTRLLEEALR